MSRLLILTGLFFAILLAGCSSSTNSGEKLYDLKGTVTAINPEQKRIKINHEDIPGLMAAMEMPFQVEDAKIIDGLAAGDRVEGKLKVVERNYIIIELHKTGAGGSAAPKAKDDPEAEVKAALARLPEQDRKLAEAQNLCPIGDERLGSMGVPIKLTLKDQTVFICCKRCQKPAERDPEGTLKKLAGLKKK